MPKLFGVLKEMSVARYKIFSLYLHKQLLKNKATSLRKTKSKWRMQYTSQ